MGKPLPVNISAWSFSRLDVYEKCPLQAKLKYIHKIPEPDRPLPPGKDEHANERGSRVHDSAEFYVRNNVELIPELRTFKAEFHRLRELFREGKVSLEGEWGFDKDWEPIQYNSASIWLRVKLDALVHLSKTHGVVIDYKTGRRHGNEIKHAEQTQLYVVATFLRYPELETIDVELWYTDQNELAHMRFMRHQGMRFFTTFNNRGKALTSATDFKPKANIFSCKWCPYHPNRSGDCQYGV